MFKSSLLQLTTELIFGFLALFAITKFIGKSQMEQITPFNFVSAIVLGELLGNAIYDDNVKIWTILFAIALWGSLIVLVELVTQRFRKTRKVLEGEPAIIIRDGQIDYKVIKKEKLDVNELLSLLRQNNAFSVREIEFAILEQSGNVSVLKKASYNGPTIKDLNLPDKVVYLPVTLILDGEVLKDNLKAVGYDENWLLGQVLSYGAKKNQ